MLLLCLMSEACSVFVGSPESEFEEDKSQQSKEDAGYSDEEISIPVDILGTYLFCTLPTQATASDPSSKFGCGFRTEAGQPVAIDESSESWSIHFPEASASGVGVEAKDKESPYYPIEIVLSAADPDQLNNYTSGLTYTVTVSKGDQQEVITIDVEAGTATSDKADPGNPSNSTETTTTDGSTTTVNSGTTSGSTTTIDAPQTEPTIHTPQTDASKDTDTVSSGGSATPVDDTPSNDTPAQDDAYQVSNCHELYLQGIRQDGNYRIDIDQEGAKEPIDVTCDFIAEGEVGAGGWTLVLNYVHAKTTNPAKTLLTTAPPLQNSDGRGDDGSLKAESWGHASNDLVKAIGGSAVRFYCESSSHERIATAFTADPNCFNYISTGLGSCVTTNWTFFAGHSALDIPDHENPAGDSDKGDQAMVRRILSTSEGYTNRRFLSKNSDDGWNCDNTHTDADTIPHDTIHRIWVR